VDDRQIHIPAGTEVRDILAQADLPASYPVLVALVDNKVVDLAYRLTRNCRVRFLHAGDAEGMRAYHRSLIFVLTRAARELYPERNLVVAQSLGSGLYCHFSDNRSLKDSEIVELEQRMRTILHADEPFLLGDLTA